MLPLGRLSEATVFSKANHMFFNGRSQRPGQNLPRGDAHDRSPRYAGCLLSHIQTWYWQGKG